MKRLLVGLLLLAGCAPTFRPAGVPLTPYEVDLAACRREQAQVPPGPQWGGLAGVLFLADYAKRRDRVLEDCMTGRGYVKE